MPRKFDPGYSFQSSESLSQRDRERRSDEGEDCSQGSWCHAATRDDEGSWHPARTFQSFCPACRSAIAGRLAELPEACVRMLVQIGERPKTGKAVRVPPGPREPIRLEVDALVREMAFVLGSWHERVADVDNLTAPDMKAAVRHPARAIAEAVKILSPRIDALLALQPEPMVRHFHQPGAAERAAEGTDPSRPWAAGSDGRVLPSGEAYLLPELGGKHAGKEILDLHHRARRITGTVRARPESFDGIPCRSCEAMSLERAEPPSDPSRPADHSRCAECHDTMSRETYDEWVSYYRGWAEQATGLSCRRCQKGAHDQCVWAACDCRAGEHAEDTFRHEHLGRFRRRPAQGALSAGHRRHLFAPRQDGPRTRPCHRAPPADRRGRRPLVRRISRRPRRHRPLARAHQRRRSSRAGGCARCSAPSTCSAFISRRSTSGRIPTSTSARSPSSSPRRRRGSTTWRSTRRSASRCCGRSLRAAPARLALPRL